MWKIKLVLREGVEPSIPCGPGILSPMRMPVPPPELIWRRQPELNRCKRFCRPLPNRSAMTPCLKHYTFLSEFLKAPLFGGARFIYWTTAAETFGTGFKNLR
jgi:hypothetical protein